METNVGRRELLWRAFANQYNLILLAASVGFSLALPSPWPAIGAGVVELIWLLSASSSEGFERWVAGQSYRQLRDRGAANTAQLMLELDPSYKPRVEALSHAAEDIRRLALARGLEQSLIVGGQDKLDALIDAFVNMGLAHQRLTRVAGETQGTNLEEEMLRLGQRLADEKDSTVRLSLRQALLLGQRRLKQHEQLDGTRRALEVKMSTLQMSFDFVRSQVFAGASADELTSSLDELLVGARFVPEMETEGGTSMTHMRALAAVNKPTPAEPIPTVRATNDDR